MGSELNSHQASSDEKNTKMDGDEALSDAEVIKVFDIIKKIVDHWY